MQSSERQSTRCDWWYHCSPREINQVNTETLVTLGEPLVRCRVSGEKQFVILTSGEAASDKPNETSAHEDVAVLKKIMTDYPSVKFTLHAPSLQNGDTLLQAISSGGQVLPLVSDNMPSSSVVHAPAAGLQTPVAAQWHTSMRLPEVTSNQLRQHVETQANSELQQAIQLSLAAPARPQQPQKPTDSATRSVAIEPLKTPAHAQNQIKRPRKAAASHLECPTCGAGE